MRALALELGGRLAGARVQKVTATGERSFGFRLRLADGTLHWLELSLEPQADGVLLDPPRLPGGPDGPGAEPPDRPGFWLAQLRRHLGGARLTGVDQPGWERILRLGFLGRDALGDPARYELVAELMGTRSNLLLVGEDGRILDALRRASPDENPARPVLPGLPYQLPPPPREPRWQPEEGEAALLERLAAAARTGRPAAKALAAAVAGMGPAHARLALEAAGQGGAGRLPEEPAALARLAGRVAAMLGAAGRGDFRPAVMEEPGAEEAVAVLPEGLPAGRPRLRPVATVSQAVAETLARRGERWHLERRRRTLLQPVRAEVERLRRRLEAQRRELEEAGEADAWRREAELLLAYAASFAPGQRGLDVPDHFEAGQPLRRLELEPGERPVERAQRLFHRYRRAVRRRQHLEPVLAATEERLRYLESVLLELEEAENPAELADVEAEMEAEGLLPAPRQTRARRREPPASTGPLRLLSHDGWEIWLGRNNRQNEELTMRLARPDDLWFHARGLPGAHVLLPVRGREQPPERTRLEAAALAALHSGGRRSSSVEVDWTERRNVWKPRGAPPGFVLYRNERTLAVRPDPELEADLRSLSGVAGSGASGPA